MGGELVQVEQPPRECCQNVENRTELERVNDELSFTRCSVCNARHWVVVAETADIVGWGVDL